MMRRSASSPSTWPIACEREARAGTCGAPQRRLGVPVGDAREVLLQDFMRHLHDAQALIEATSRSGRRKQRIDQGATQPFLIPISRPSRVVAQHAMNFGRGERPHDRASVIGA